MKKEYKKHKGENLAQWCERIAAACQGRSLSEVHEMISEVSKTSYIEGVHAEREINAKYPSRQQIYQAIIGAARAETQARLMYLPSRDDNG